MLLKLRHLMDAVSRCLSLSSMFCWRGGGRAVMAGSKMPTLIIIIYICILELCGGDSIYQ